MAKRKTSKKTLYTKDFARLVADEANFTVGDVLDILKAMKVVFHRIVESETEVLVGGLFELRYRTLAPRKMWIGLEKRYREVVESKRLVFKLAPNYSKKLNTLNREKNAEEDFDS